MVAAYICVVMEKGMVVVRGMFDDDGGRQPRLKFGSCSCTFSNSDPNFSRVYHLWRTRPFSFK